MNPPPRILPLHSFFFFFFYDKPSYIHPVDAHSPFSTRSTKRIQRPRDILRNFFQFPGSRRQFNSRERSKLGAAGVGANFKKSGGRPSLAGPVTAIETTYLVVETRMAGLSFPSPPTVWTPDFPLRRLPLLLITCRQIQFAEQ